MIDFLNNNITRRTCLLGRRRLLQVRVVQLYVLGTVLCSVETDLSGMN